MVNKEVRKIDSEAIVTGKPIYTEDLIFHKDVLTIKLLRSPHAFAKIKNIDTKCIKGKRCSKHIHLQRCSKL